MSLSKTTRDYSTMRCKACNSILSPNGDDTYCNKCIKASEDMDMYNDTKYKDNYVKYNHELRVQLFLSEYEKKEIGAEII